MRAEAPWTRDSFAPWESKLLLLLAALAIVRSWLMPLGSSLWLDETATWWIASGGPGEVSARAATWLAQSHAHGVVTAYAVRLLGDTEVVMRLPSLLAMLVAVLALACLAERLDGRRSAAIVAVLFLADPDVAFSAADARPYAFALAALLGSTLFLVRWLDSDRWLYLALWSGLGGIVPLFQPVLSLGWIWGVWFTFLRLSKERPVSVRRGLLAAAGWSLSCVSLLPHVVSLSSNAARLSFAEPPPLATLASYLAHPALIAGALTALAIALSIGLPLAWNGGTGFGSTARATILWWLLPVAAAFALSRWTPANVFVGRYLLSSVPGAVLLTGILTARFKSPTTRALWTSSLVLWCVALSAGGALWPSHGKQDWRGALGYARGLAAESPTTTIVASGFVEAQGFVGSSGTPSEPGPYHAPVARYGADLHCILLPHWPTGETWTALESALRIAESKVDRLVVVQQSHQPYFRWLEGRLTWDGYALVELHSFEGVMVTLFERPQSGSA